jgi:hypothetical protein
MNIQRKHLLSTPESQTAAILIDYSTKVMFNKYSKKASTINIAESQTAVISTINTTIVTMNKASDKACSINYLKLQSITILIQSSSAQSIHKVKLIFYEDTIENLKTLKT